MVGFDYEALADAFEYFNLTIYIPLRYAFAHGLKRIHLGRESYVAKLRRGAVAEPLWSVEVPRAGRSPVVGKAWRAYNTATRARWCRDHGAELDLPDAWVDGR